MSYQRAVSKIGLTLGQTRHILVSTGPIGALVAAVNTVVKQKTQHCNADP